MKDKYMQRAIELALKGKGKTSPNPIVGAVILNKGDMDIVGEGYHKKAGTPHAEVNAIGKAGKKAKGGAMYVTLEPCCHTGKTPPCTKTIIKSGIKKVVVGMYDPNPLVSGKGVKELKDAGIHVRVGLLGKEIMRINEIYLKYITTGSPFVMMKVGMSLDGKIATSFRESKWITSETARRKVHQLRSEVDAIMVGIGTLLQDDPSLTIRLKGRQNHPVRVVVDSMLKVPLDSNVLDDSSLARTLILTTEKSSETKRKEIEKRGGEVLLVKEKKGRVCLKSSMKELGKKGITSIMLEGGSELNYSFLEEGIVDKVLFFIAPKIIGGHAGVSSIGGVGVERLKDAFTVNRISTSTIGKDILVEGYLN